MAKLSLKMSGIMIYHASLNNFGLELRQLFY